MIKNFSMISFIDFSSKNSGGVSLILFISLGVVDISFLTTNIFFIFGLFEINSVKLGQISESSLF